MVAGKLEPAQLWWCYSGHSTKIRHWWECENAMDCVSPVVDRSFIPIRVSSLAWLYSNFMSHYRLVFGFVIEGMRFGTFSRIWLNLLLVRYSYNFRSASLLDCIYFAVRWLYFLVYFRIILVMRLGPLFQCPTFSRECVWCYRLPLATGIYITSLNPVVLFVYILSSVGLISIVVFVEIPTLSDAWFYIYCRWTYFYCKPRGYWCFWFSLLTEQKKWYAFDKCILYWCHI